MPGVLFAVCFLRSDTAFTDDQYLRMTSPVPAKIVQMKLQFTRFWTGCCPDYDGRLRPNFGGTRHVQVLELRHSKPAPPSG